MAYHQNPFYHSFKKLVKRKNGEKKPEAQKKWALKARDNEAIFLLLVRSLFELFIFDAVLCYKTSVKCMMAFRSNEVSGVLWWRDLWMRINMAFCWVYWLFRNERYTRIHGPARFQFISPLRKILQFWTAALSFFEWMWYMHFSYHMQTSSVTVMLSDLRHVHQKGWLIPIYLFWGRNGFWIAVGMTKSFSWP